MDKTTLPKWMKIAGRHPIWTFRYVMERSMDKRMDDETFLRFIYEFKFEKPLNLVEPKGFNEKLQWLKLYDRKPVYTTMVDKYAVKSFVADKIGEEYVIPTYGVWDHFDDIDFNLLPDQFVLKCTHDSGGLVIVRDKKELDKDMAREKIEACLKRNYYYQGREWPYRDVKPRVIAEKYMEDGKPEASDKSLNDYKVLCFHGVPKLIEVHQGRRTAEHYQDFYDTDWTKTSIQQEGEKNSPHNLPKPNNIDKMLRLSKLLSEGISHLRVDWYSVDGRLYFGELTFYDSSGLCRFKDERDELEIGSWIELEKIVV